MKYIFTLLFTLAIFFNTQAQITDTGTNVGIGTTTPFDALDVRGSGGVSANRVGWQTWDNFQFGVRTDLSVAHYGISRFYEPFETLEEAPKMAVSGFYGLKFFTRGQQRMDIDAYGNVGIGTTTPDSKLEVAGTIRTYTTDSSQYLLMYGGTTGNFIDTYGTDFYLRSNADNSKSIILKEDGNVGIGTSSTVNAKLNIQAGAITNSSERLTEFKISDSDDYLRVINATNTNGQFIPSLFSSRESDSRESLGFYASTNDENDTGLSPLMFFDSRRNDAVIENRPLFAWNSFGVRKMTLDANGNVGIGTATPAERLEVRGNGVFDTGDIHSFIKLGSGRDFIYSDDTDTDYYGGGLWFRIEKRDGTGTLDSMILDDLGNVGIGTRDTQGFKLGVDGKIAATEIKVALYDDWSDFVFEKDYNLPTLKEVEKHINKKGHLKDIPSAKEVAKDGFFLGEMDAKLLQKIEELTLYTIDQEKKIDAQNKENQLLKDQLLQLAKRLEKLEAE